MRLAAEFFGPPGSTLTPRHVSGSVKISALKAAPAVSASGMPSITARARLLNGSPSARMTNGPHVSKAVRVASKGSRAKLKPTRNAAGPVNRTGFTAAAAIGLALGSERLGVRKPCALHRLTLQHAGQQSSGKRRQPGARKAANDLP